MNRSSFLKRLGLIAVGIAIAPTAAFTKSNQWVAYKFSATTIKVSDELLNGASCDVMNEMTRLLAERMAIVLKGRVV
jgi:hypothetical protein